MSCDNLQVGLEVRGRDSRRLDYSSPDCPDPAKTNFSVRWRKESIFFGFEL